MRTTRRRFTSEGVAPLSHRVTIPAALDVTRQLPHSQLLASRGYVVATPVIGCAHARILPDCELTRRLISSRQPSTLTTPKCLDRRSRGLGPESHLKMTVRYGSLFVLCPDDLSGFGKILRPVFMPASRPSGPPGGSPAENRRYIARVAADVQCLEHSTLLIHGRERSSPHDEWALDSALFQQLHATSSRLRARTDHEVLTPSARYDVRDRKIFRVGHVPVASLPLFLS